MMKDLENHKLISREKFLNANVENDKNYLDSYIRFNIRRHLIVDLCIDDEKEQLSIIERVFNDETHENVTNFYKDYLIWVDDQSALTNLERVKRQNTCPVAMQKKIKELLSLKK